MVAAGGAIVAKDALLSYANRSVAQQDVLGDTGTRAQQHAHVSITGAKNILPIGVDARPGQDHHLITNS
jgi:polyisoprenyl-teichoic acid--peptidoglycan teichoic acid transferase